MINDARRAELANGLILMEQWRPASATPEPPRQNGTGSVQLSDLWHDRANPLEKRPPRVRETASRIVELANELGLGPAELKGFQADFVQRTRAAVNARLATGEETGVREKKASVDAPRQARHQTFTVKGTVLSIDQASEVIIVGLNNGRTIDMPMDSVLTERQIASFNRGGMVWPTDEGPQPSVRVGEEVAMEFVHGSLAPMRTLERRTQPDRRLAPLDFDPLDIPSSRAANVRDEFTERWRKGRRFARPFTHGTLDAQMRHLQELWSWFSTLRDPLAMLIALRRRSSPPPREREREDFLAVALGKRLRRLHDLVEINAATPEERAEFARLMSARPE